MYKWLQSVVVPTFQISILVCRQTQFFAIFKKSMRLVCFKAKESQSTEKLASQRQYFGGKWNRCVRLLPYYATTQLSMLGYIMQHQSIHHHRCTRPFSFIFWRSVSVSVCELQPAAVRYSGIVRIPIGRSRPKQTTLHPVCLDVAEYVSSMLNARHSTRCFSCAAFVFD